MNISIENYRAVIGSFYNIKVKFYKLRSRRLTRDIGAHYFRKHFATLTQFLVAVPILLLLLTSSVKNIYQWLYVIDTSILLLENEFFRPSSTFSFMEGTQLNLMSFFLFKMVTNFENRYLFGNRSEKV